jgi:catechol 2,3-dioxygenase-like lactoylglutathione lyase family enzyme
VALDVTDLDHVTVTVPEDLEDEAIAWYENVLALRRVEQLPGAGSGGAWFACGDRQVHISLDPHNALPKAHFCVTVADFDAAVEHLRASNCHIEQASEIPGRRRCFTRDPAGNRIEIMAYTG